MPAASGINSLLDLLQRDPNAGGRRGIPQPGPMPGPMPGAPAQQDMMDQRVSSGMPLGRGTEGFASDLGKDPNNWFLTRGDLENPLGYMAWRGTSPYVPGSWNENRDKGGFFTLDQLYANQPGGVPEMFAYGSNMPSTNNWQLTGGGPGTIMRNGQVIQLGPMAARGQYAGSTGTGVAGSGEDPGSAFPVNVPPGATLSGNNVWAQRYWPGGSFFASHPGGRKERD